VSLAQLCVNAWWALVHTRASAESMLSPERQMSRCFRSSQPLGNSCIRAASGCNELGCYWLFGG
jgi:hypothetical protein